jgi:hypothetical protein
VAGGEPIGAEAQRPTARVRGRDVEAREVGTPSAAIGHEEIDRVRARRVG